MKNLSTPPHQGSFRQIGVLGLAAFLVSAATAAFGAAHIILPDFPCGETATEAGLFGFDRVSFPFQSAPR
jgi:hypothetical protein